VERELGSIAVDIRLLWPFLHLGMQSWADVTGFTAAVVEPWLSCDTGPE